MPPVAHRPPLLSAVLRSTSLPALLNEFEATPYSPSVLLLQWGPPSNYDRQLGLKYTISGDASAGLFDATSFLVVGLTENTNYTFSITATSSTGLVGAADTITMATLPSVPISGPTATSLEFLDDNVTLRFCWSDPDRVSFAVSEYRVFAECGLLLYVNVPVSYLGAVTI